LDVKPPPIDIGPWWVWAMSLVGAVASYLEDFKIEDGWKVWLLKLLTKCTTSALAGVLAYHSLLALDVDAKWHLIVVAVTAHMGTEALKFMGEIVKARAVK
jgi:hypothetical protein